MGGCCSKPQDDVEEVTLGVKNLGIVRDDGGGGNPGGNPKGGFVYVIEEMRENGGPHFYKFGQSKDPTDRRQSLQTGNPRELKIIAMTQRLDDCVAAEQHLMKQFEKYNCHKEMNGGTEWFKVGEDQNEAFRQEVVQKIQQLNSLYGEQ